MAGPAAADGSASTRPPCWRTSCCLPAAGASNAGPTTCASLPGPAAAATLAAVQDRALRLEPALLRVPERALHANLAWLLAVHQDFGRPKDELWDQHGRQWTATLADIAGKTGRFRVRFQRLAATSSAVITVADEPNRLSALRRELIPLLDLPGSASAGDLVHITLFRYAKPLHDPAALLQWLEAAEFRIDIDIGELLKTLKGGGYTRA